MSKFETDYNLFLFSYLDEPPTSSNANQDNSAVYVNTTIEPGTKIFIHISISAYCTILAMKSSVVFLLENKQFPVATPGVELAKNFSCPPPAPK